MEYKEFKKTIQTYKKTCKLFEELYSIGFDFLENEKFPIWGQVDELFAQWISSHYTEEGHDWVSWFIYENDYGKLGLTAHDNELPICTDLKSLFDYIQQYKK